MRALLLAIATIAASGLIRPVYAAGEAANPYAGQQARAIKALSEADLAGLRGGEGMGLAKAAELNGYPGPRHVLDLSRELGLRETQKQQVTAVKDRMSTAARSLGATLIEREAALDRLFAGGEITPERLSEETAAIGKVQARLRAAHLQAHIETRAILSTEQVAQYNRLRGYEEPASTPAHHGGHRH
jgi:Spy/CpxP family protein refolding chaperone